MRTGRRRIHYCLLYVLSLRERNFTRRQLEATIQTNRIDVFHIKGIIRKCSKKNDLYKTGVKNNSVTVHNLRVEMLSLCKERPFLLSYEVRKALAHFRSVFSALIHVGFQINQTIMVLYFYILSRAMI